MARRQRSRNAKAERIQSLPPLMDVSAFDLSESEFDFLLGDLCVDLGFCISGPASQRLWESRPATVDEFVAGLFLAEGLQSDAKGSLGSAVKLHVRKFIAARRTP